jgi:broad specificity phosphatase PhoE
MTEGNTIYAMRHGETEDNVSNIITAQADSPLTTLGRKQVAEKGRLLRQLVGDLDSIAFYSSPLHRACVTMEIARSAAGLAPQSYSTDPRLMEMNFGDWTKRREGEDRYGPELPSAHEKWDLQPPGGESQETVYFRVGQFMRSVTRDSIIVCHARIITMIRSHVLGLSPEQTMRCKPPNAGILHLSMGREAWLGSEPRSSE